MNLTPLMSNDATAVGGDASAPNRTVVVATQRSEVNSTTTVESQGDRSVVLTLSRAAEASAEADPVGRAQKIATLTSLVREGKYTVSSIDIAESMIRKGVLEGVDTPFVV